MIDLIFTIPTLTIEYPGYFPDFGLLKHIIYAYSDSDLDHLHAAWDGFCIVVLPVLFYLLYLSVKKVLLYRKRQQVLKFIHQFSINDPFWDANKMKEISTEMFHQVQYAWMKNEFRSMAPWLSDKLKIEWQDTWLKMQKADYAFFAGRIDITRVTIIAVEDHFDNYKDKFSVEISGYMKRYIKDRSFNALAPKNSMELQFFTDIYSFVRWEEQWLLDGIQYYAKFTDILEAKNMNYN